MGRKPEVYIELPNDRIGVLLTKGKMAIIDSCDLPLIEGRRWQTKTGCTGKTFYANATIIIDGKRQCIGMHALILPKKDGFVTDHIDGDGLNNTRANLRYATRFQNAHNCKAPEVRLRRSQYKGVSFSSWPEERKKKWRATITANGKRVDFGYYHTDVEAAKAYDAAAIKYHGEFASLNFPGECHE